MIDTQVDGDPGAVRTTARWLDQALATDLDSAAESGVLARRAARGGWDGQARDAYDGFARELVSATDAHVRRTRRAADAHRTYADRLQRLQDRMSELRDEAGAGGLVVTGSAILPPADAPAVPALPPEAMPTEAARHDELRAVHQRQVARIELYARLGDEVAAARESFLQYCDGDLAVDQRDSEDAAELDTLRGFVEDNIGNFLIGTSITFSDQSLQRRAADYLRRARDLAAARRSGNPARRALGTAPGSRAQVREWRRAARGLSRFSRFLGPVGVAVDVGFGVWDVSQGGSPGRATLTTAASIAGGAAVVAGATALAAAGIVTAPVWGTALAAGTVAVGVGWLAGEAWDALPDDFTGAVDDKISSAWDATTGAVSGGWDAATDVVGGGWGAVTGWL